MKKQLARALALAVSLVGLGLARAVDLPDPLVRFEFANGDLTNTGTAGELTETKTVQGTFETRTDYLGNVHTVNVTTGSSNNFTRAKLDALNLLTDNGVTVTFWATLPSAAWRDAFACDWVKTSNATSRYWQVWERNNNGALAVYSGASSDATNELGGVVLASSGTDTLDHYAIVVSGQQVSFYRNGAVVSSETRDWLTETSKLYAISNGGSLTRAGHGGVAAIADVRIYNSALTGDQVAQIALGEDSALEVLTVSVAGEATASGLEIPESATLAKIIAEDEAMLTFDLPSELTTLTLAEGEEEGTKSLTLLTDGEGSLTATTTAVNVNTIVASSEIALGTVTQASGKRIHFQAAPSAPVTIPSSQSRSNGIIVEEGVGTDEAPVHLIGTAKDKSFGYLSLKANTVTRLTFSDNQVLSAKGADPDSSILVVERGDSSFGVTDDADYTFVSDLTLRIAPTGGSPSFWHERSYFLDDGSCNLDVESPADFYMWTNASVRNLSGNGRITQYGSRTLTVAPGTACEFSGVISGPALTVGGSAPLTLSGANTANRTLRLNAGSQVVLSGTWAGNYEVNGELTLAGATAATLANKTVTGAGTLVFQQDAPLATSGANLSGFTGTVVPEAGALNLGTARGVTLGAIGETASVALELIATEGVDGVVQIPTTMEALPAEGKISVTYGGNPVELADVTLDEGMLTLAFDPFVPVVETSGVWSDILTMLAEGDTSLLIRGGETEEDTVTVAVDVESPETLTAIQVAGRVAFVAEGQTVLPAGVTLMEDAVLTVEGLDLSEELLVAEGQTLVLRDTTVTQAVTVRGVLYTEGDVAMTSGSNAVASAGTMEVLSGTTVYNCTERGLRGTLRVDSGAEFQCGRNDAPDYNGAPVFVIAGTLNVTGTARWSIPSGASVTLEDGAVLAGVGGTGYNYAYDFYSGGTIVTSGEVLVAGNIGSHNSNIVRFDVQSGTTTLAGNIDKGAYSGNGISVVKEGADSSVLRIESTGNVIGGITVSTGYLTIAGGSAIPEGCTVTALSGTAIRLDSTEADLTVACILSNGANRIDCLGAEGRTTTITGDIRGAGQLNVLSGTLAVASALTRSASALTLIDAGATLDVSAEGALLYSTDFGGVDSGVTMLVRGTLVPGNWAYGASLGGLRSNAYAVMVDGGTVRFSGVAAVGSRGFTVTENGATLEVAEGTVFTQTGNETLYTQLAASGTLAVTGGGTVLFSQTQAIPGTVTVASGTTLGGATTYSGTLRLASGAILDAASPLTVTGALELGDALTVLLPGEEVPEEGVCVVAATGLEAPETALTAILGETPVADAVLEARDDGLYVTVPSTEPPEPDVTIPEGIEGDAADALIAAAKAAGVTTVTEVVGDPEVLALFPNTEVSFDGGVATIGAYAFGVKEIAKQTVGETPCLVIVIEAEDLATAATVSVTDVAGNPLEGMTPVDAATVGREEVEGEFCFTAPLPDSGTVTLFRARASR